MIELVSTLLFFLCLVNAKSQPVFSASKTPAAQIPKTVLFRGHMQEAWKWKDGMGENILI